MTSLIVNPFTPWRVSQGWHSAHRAIDYATPWGTVFTAPASGVYEHLGGSLDYSPNPTNPGLYGQVRLSDGHRIIVCHLSAHIAAHGAEVVVGETEVAATGNSGHVKPRPTPANPYNGSHMHTYGLTPTGERWDWTLAAQPAGGNARPFPTPTDPIYPIESEDDDMNLFLMTCEHIAGTPSRGLDRWLVNPWEKTKRLISSEEEALYKTAGLRQVPGLQPKAYGDMYRTVP